MPFKCFRVPQVEDHSSERHELGLSACLCFIVLVCFLLAELLAIRNSLSQKLNGNFVRYLISCFVSWWLVKYPLSMCYMVT
jgi:cell division protein FtsW (lipid II flippase)